MHKRFKTKRKLKYGIIVKYLFVLLIGYIIIRLCLSLILKTPILSFTFKPNKLSSYKQYIIDATINNPQVLLSFYQEKEISTTNEETIMANYILNEKPLVYIYNTHQTESFSDKKTVLDAAHIMKEEFNKYNIDVIVEERNITEFMRTNNMNYNYSYYASKFYIEDILEKNKVDFLIDLHRDATSKKVSTVQLNKKSYAKILFVVGGEHKNYKENYALANNLNKLIKKKYPTLTRGVVLKTGNNVNGIYNQNLNKNMILLEIGSDKNTFQEVKNTISLIIPIIGEYIYEK